MKKLIKTAKQQFEERLNELENPFIEKISNTTYYSCNDNDGHYVVLSKYEDSYDEYSEYISSRPLIDIYTDSDFLCSLVDYWNEYRHEHLKDLFEWYATADKDNPPFDVEVILQCYDRFSCTSFNDYYEEVADVRIITAKEQWERDSKNAKVATTLDNGSIYKVEVTEQSITFYVFKGDCYTKSIFPPFSELRKDNKFIIKYLELVRMLHDGDMDYALSWLAGGEYKMCELSLLDIYESSQEIDGMEYEDKELPQEQFIEKKDFSTEITDLKERMIKHIKELHKQGMALNSDFFLENAYSITWSDGSYYACENLVSCKLTKSDEGVLCFSETQVNDKDVTYDSPLSTLTINTLWSIIDAMR